MDVAPDFRLFLRLARLDGAVVGFIFVMVGKGLTRSMEREYLKLVLNEGLVRGGSGRDTEGVYGKDIPAIVELGECDNEGAWLIVEKLVEVLLYCGRGVREAESVVCTGWENCRR